MTMLSKAQAGIAKVKLGLYGEAGSGKTYTALKLAFGLGKKVAVFDTEHSTDFYAAEFDFHVVHSRKIEDLLTLLTSGELNDYDVLIVDSVTHIWENVQSSYIESLKRSKNPKKKAQGEREELQFQDWAKIKRPWKKMMALFLSMDIHVIFTGRLSYIYEMKNNELSVIGDKMKAEGEAQYEPSILVKMELKNGKNVATVLKDRSNTIMGQAFESPDIEMLKPVIKKLSKKHSIKTSEEEEEVSSVFDEKEEDIDFPKEEMISKRQLESIKNLVEEASELTGAAIEKIMAGIRTFISKFGAEELQQLTKEQADKVIEIMSKKVAQAKLQKTA